MKRYIIISTPDNGITLTDTEIRAEDYTKAYLGASFKLPRGEEIIRVCEVA